MTGRESSTSDLTVTMASFADRFGHQPDGLWSAPGRVNLIGEHTDYNQGYVLPFAVQQQAIVAASARGDQRVLVASTQFPDTVTTDLDAISPDSRLGSWADYLIGVLWALKDAGELLGGVELLVDSRVPIGAGLSSSAAIECAAMAAICDLFEIDLADLEQARLAQRAENRYVGAPTGLMDQAAATLSRPDHALFLDCRSLYYDLVPLPLSADGLEIVVVNTGVTHSHVDGEYKTRRQQCQAAAAELGADSLRDITDVALLQQLTDPQLRRRARHVVTENHRVLEVVTLATEGRVSEIGPLLTDSHRSMRDDFQITVPAVDLAVETALSAGALGARMTGGGFGGCIIALTPIERSEQIAQQVIDAFVNNGFAAPTWFVAQPSAGAHRLH